MKSKSKFDRRRVLLQAGVAVFAAWCLPSNSAASESAPRLKPVGTGNLVIRSGSGFVPHTHDLVIPYAILRAPPPRGVKLISTNSFLHTHEVVLTQAQLVAVIHGETVIATGGSHTFAIALGRAIDG